MYTLCMSKTIYAAEMKSRHISKRANILLPAGMEHSNYKNVTLEGVHYKQNGYTVFFKQEDVPYTKSFIGWYGDGAIIEFL